METPMAFKDIEINGRKFRLNKLNARTGSFMLVNMIGILTPLIKNVKKESLKNMNLEDVNITEIAEQLSDIPETKFRYIQDNLLQIISELLPAGGQPILTKDLTWGVLNIEFDMSLVMNLTIQSLVFNLSGFFGESLLASLMKG